MEARVLQLTVNCRRPDRLVEFWHAILGYEVPPAPSPHATWRDYYLSVGEAPESIDGDGRDRLSHAPTSLASAFGFRPFLNPKAGKNRLHLDLQVSGGRKTEKAHRRAAIDSVVNEIVQRGGQLVDWHDDVSSAHLHATVADPEGNEFCLV